VKRWRARATPDLLQRTVLDNASYDSSNRLATFHQKVERVTRGAVGPDGTVDGSKALLNDVRETNRTEATFDERGSVTGYTETQTHKDGAGNPAGGSVTHRRKMEYHPLGSLRAYEGDETKAESPDIVADVSWRGTFDRHMRTEGFVERRVESLAGGEKGLETTTVRKNGVYDDFGQMMGYRDTVERSDEPESVRTVIWENALFDDQGNLESYRETTQRGAKGLSVGFNNVKVLDRTGTRYDGHGQVAGYLETQRDSAQPHVTVQTERKATRYDVVGREIGSESLRHESGESRETTQEGDVIVSSLDKWTTVVQGERIYNGVGQVEGYKEVSFDGVTLDRGGGGSDWQGLLAGEKAGYMDGSLKAEELVTLVEWKSAGYDRMGRTMGQEESVRELSSTMDHRRTVVRGGVGHNQLHQLERYEDTTIDDAMPGVTETVTVSGAQYNGWGQLKRVHEVRGQSGMLVSRMEGDRSLSYDSEGRTQRDRSTMVSDNGVRVERDYRVESFNGLGRVGTERTVTVRTGISAEGDVAYDIRGESVRSGMGYDQNGRLVRSEER
jgi:hypothetical protein